MKKSYLIIVLAAFMIAGCTQRPMLNEGGNSSLPKYYAYNPEDTIENFPFLEMLRIDSTMVEYRMDHPISQMSSIEYDGLNVDEKTPEQRLQDDLKVYTESESKWHELLQLCSQRQYEELLSMYIKEETDIGIALATSTNKFELDYLVIGPLLFNQLEVDEAAEIMVKFLEYDKFLAESVILFGESQQGYVPPQYAFQIEILSKVYLMLDEWEKVETLMDPYRKAVYLLSDDTLTNEFAVMDFKLNLYGDMDDKAKIKEAFVGFRDFLVQYAKDTHQDLDEQIENMDKLITSAGK